MVNNFLHLFYSSLLSTQFIFHSFAAPDIWRQRTKSIWVCVCVCGIGKRKEIISTFCDGQAKHFRRKKLVGGGTKKDEPWTIVKKTKTWLAASNGKGNDDEEEANQVLGDECEFGGNRSVN